MIVDECPGCGPNHLDLFPDAFAALADPSKGVINVSWDYVACPISSPLQIHMVSRSGETNLEGDTLFSTSGSGDLPANDPILRNPASAPTGSARKS